MSDSTPADGLRVELVPLRPALCNAPDRTLDVLVRVQAPAKAPATRTPLSLALVIDRSGSMDGPKLEAARDCARDLVARLQPEDEVSIVAYDHEVQLPLSLAPAGQAQSTVACVLATIASGGQTNLHGGWLAGAQQLAARTASHRLCRVVLLSDGQANAGVVDQQAIAQQVRLLAQSGVSTTTVGLGTGFNEGLMTAIALAGQGTAHYGERAQDLAEPFEAELGLLAHLAWRDVRLTSGSATSRVTLLNDHAPSGPHEWSLPAIAAGTEAWACFSLPMGSAVRAQARSSQGKALHVTIRARDAAGLLHESKASLAALPVVTEEQWLALPADELVARRLAEVRAAQLQRRAREAVQARRWDEAQQLLGEVERLAVDQPWIRSSLDHLKALLARRDHDRIEKELMYSAATMSRRVAPVVEAAAFDLGDEATKPAYLRRKAVQGRGGQG